MAARGTSVIFSTHDAGEVQRYAERVLVLADGELLFDGPPTEVPREAGEAERGLRETHSSRSYATRGHPMRWLLRKDLLILGRSRLTVALLVIYPVRSRC